MMKTMLMWHTIFSLSIVHLLAADWKSAEGPLKTKWAAHVSPSNALPEYPRPQMVRKDWLNLNGLWDYTITPAESARPTTFGEKILVPFPIESALSGVMKTVGETNRLWYRRTFTVPKNWKKQRVLLHFGAVDWEAKVFVNATPVGSHRGGYDGFTIDITDALKSGANELTVSVWDPTDAGTQPRGKQIRDPHGIWYTPVSGIWQTVWLEPVPASYLGGIKLIPDVDQGVLKVLPKAINPGAAKSIEVSIRDAGVLISSARTNVGDELVIPVPNPTLWTPETPHLYDLEITLKEGNKTIDSIKSYFAMRSTSLGKDDNGFTRILLNGKPYFQFGPLDQGYWPDGLYTAPTDEALRYDIEMTKKLGFNMARKHVKVEPDRWYYWCDKLGLLVWQDMPSGEKYIKAHEPDIQRTTESANQFELEWKEVIDELGNHPCIVMWVPFNEGWGQYDTERIARWTKHYDPTRIVNSVSGWADRGVGDLNDMHKYPGPGSPEPEEKRAVVLGEFGGLGLPITNHTWQAEKNWGYQSFDSVEGLTAAYVKLIRSVFPYIESHGLSAAVYTQTTDVEIEVNGLMTYDRELVKPILERIVPANLGKLPPLPKKLFVAGTADQGTNMWHYTFEKPAEGWFKPEFDASSWKQGRSGFGTRGTPGGMVRTKWDSSDIWLRREFTIPKGDLKQPRFLIHHDDDVEVYINGALAAKLTGFTKDYEEAVLSPGARKALKTGTNTMAVYCRQSGGGQYIDVGLTFDAPLKNED